MGSSARRRHHCSRDNDRTAIANALINNPARRPPRMGIGSGTIGWGTPWSFICEVVRIDSLQLVRGFGRHTNTVIDHQLGELRSRDEDYLDVNTRRISHRLTGKRRRRDREMAGRSDIYCATLPPTRSSEAALGHCLLKATTSTVLASPFPLACLPFFPGSFGISVTSTQYRRVSRVSSGVLRPALARPPVAVSRAPNRGHTGTPADCQVAERRRHGKRRVEGRPAGDPARRGGLARASSRASASHDESAAASRSRRGYLRW